MKNVRKCLIVCVTLVSLMVLVGCVDDERTRYSVGSHAVLEINGHFVYFCGDEIGGRSGFNPEERTILRLGNNWITVTGALMYANEPDKRCYEYTTDEFMEHVCGTDADWRCPYYGFKAVSE